MDKNVQKWDLISVSGMSQLLQWLNDEIYAHIYFYLSMFTCESQSDPEIFFSVFFQSDAKYKYYDEARDLLSARYSDGKFNVSEHFKNYY